MTEIALLPTDVWIYEMVKSNESDDLEDRERDGKERLLQGYEQKS